MGSSGKRLGATALAFTAVVGGLGWFGPSGVAAPIYRAPSSDFNGDGYRDMVIGAPGADIGKLTWAGYVIVLYGSAKGVTIATRQVFSQNTKGVPDSSEAFDRFGDAVAVGDLNGDGYSDLGVAADHEHTDAGRNAGAITVFFGGPSGLGRAVSFAEPGGGGQDHYFGQSLATGDFDGDGRAELAISGGRAGRTFIASFGPNPGAPTGFTVKHEQKWVPLRVAAGDVTGDGYSDLVIANAGNQMTLYPGGPAGLGGRGPELPAGQSHGNNLAVGDINRDGHQDVVVGSPQSGSKGGAIRVYYGGSSGLSAGPVIGQNTPGVPGTGEQPPNDAGDQFGESVAVGDANGDGYADVAVGAGWEDRGWIGDAGAVTFFRGGAQGISLSGVKLYDQESKGIPGKAEVQDFFGAAVALVDHDRDGRAELSIGSPGEDGRGTVSVLKGTKYGPSTSGARLLSPQILRGPGGDADFGQYLSS